MKKNRPSYEKYFSASEAMYGVGNIPNKKYYIELNVLIEKLIEKLLDIRGFKTLAHIGPSDILWEGLFLNNIKHSRYLKNDKQKKLDLPNEVKYELVFSSFLINPGPYTSSHNKYVFKNSLKLSKSIDNQNNSIRSCYSIIGSLLSMKMLSDEGIGICLLSSYQQAFNIFKFREVLNDNQLNIEAILKLSALNTSEFILVLVSKNKSKREFVVELGSEESLENALMQFTKKKSSENIKDGIWFESSKFKGFYNWHYHNSLKELTSEFFNFKEFRMKDVGSIRSPKNKSDHGFIDSNNCIYCPINSSKNATINVDEISGRSHLQLVVKNSQILPDYLVSFLNSQVGRLGRAAFQNLRLALNEMTIAVPPINQQKEITTNIKKIDKLTEKIQKYAHNLSLNPLSDSNTLNKVDQLFNIISELSQADKCRAIIRRGEDISTEFKQTLRLDIEKQTVEKYISEATLKTIAAFLNTKGGDLLIGVDDNSMITGIDNELYKLHKGNKDKFLNTFKDLFKSNIGPEFYPFIDQKIIEVNDKRVFLISCKPSDKEVFMNGKDFYIRTTPATDKLEGPSQVDYIRTRFG